MTFFSWLLILTSILSSAEPRFHSFFTDNMVLQRDKPALIKGWAEPGVMVMVDFSGQSKQTRAGKDGSWSVTLDPLSATDVGSSLTCRAEGVTSLKNVIVGDVILFARQSYVDVHLGRSDEGRKAAAAFSPSNTYRAMMIKNLPSKSPRDDFQKGAATSWMTVDKKNALNMSAAAFYLGSDLNRDLDVPVGIVDVTMDRYFGIGWLSHKAIEECKARFPKDKELGWLPEWMAEKAEERDSGKAQKELDIYVEAQKKKSRGRPVKIPSLGLHPLRNPMYPSAGYNAVISPMKGLSFKGVLLQLGNDYPFIAYRDLDKNGTATVTAELDAAWQENYMILKSGYRVTEKTLPYVPEDWRRTLGDAQLPIGLILPPSSDLDTYAAHNREMRELHRRTSERLGNVHLIIPGNENRPSSGQPSDEVLLAKRAGDWALGAMNGLEGITPTGPNFDKLEAKLSKGTIFFKKGTAVGLKASGDGLNKFETAGPDRIFTLAKATIEGSTIKLKSEGPIAFVRYNYNSRPNQELTNEAGLPALPFNNDPEWTFGWIPPTQQANLPEEYSLTADKWGDSNVAIINGQIANMAQGDSEFIPRRPGPLGLVASPFGPNIYVVSTEAGGPSAGNLITGDVIYGINGEVFPSGPDVPSDEAYKVLSAAITHSETEAGGGKLLFNIRRGAELMDVELKLQIMGSYSSTTPYYCEKSENIVKNALNWSTQKFRPNKGLPSDPNGKLYTDLLFLLASGEPEHQGMVRRAIYKIIDRMEPVPVTPGMASKPWTTGYLSMVIGEYFHATGDRNVLPYLKYQADLSAESQIKPKSETPPDKEAAQTEEQSGGWRQNYPGNPDRWQSGYGLMPHAGMTCVMGMQLAKEAGMSIDDAALERGAHHYYKGRAEYGFVLYSYSNTRRDGPPTTNPIAESKGKLWSMNGKLGLAAALYDILEKKDAVDVSARHCVYGYNNTRGGHGGMFFNNFWTPIGAWTAREHAYKHFMKGQMWWRELFRRHDGSFNQVGRGGIGVSYAIAHVAHHQRLRMLGAPKSPFGTNCPEYLKPALEAHQKREYERCENLIDSITSDMIVPADDRTVVEKFLKEVRILRASLDHDFELAQKFIGEGKHYYASLELRQLKGVTHPNDPRLKSLVSLLESEQGKAKVTSHQKLCSAEQSAIKVGQKKSASQTKPKKWNPLTSRKDTLWKSKIVENVSHAPAAWTTLGYQDDDWNQTKMPVSWTMYHTALYRHRFNLESKDAIEEFRVRGQFFQQQNVVIHVNGVLVAKIDEIGRGMGDTIAPLNSFGLNQLRDGENVISISSRHKRRWGSYRGTYKTASPVSFGVEFVKK